MTYELRILNKINLLLITIEIFNINQYDNCNIKQYKLSTNLNIKSSYKKYLYCYKSYTATQIYYIYNTIQKYIEYNTLKLILEDYKNNIQGKAIQQYIKKYIYLYYQYYNYINFQHEQNIIKIAINNLYFISKIKNRHNPYLILEYFLIQKYC